MGLFHWMTRVMARRIVLVRHACTDGAPHGALVGSTDLPLSPRGLEQARELAPLVAALAPGAVYCSPLLRARQTCELAAPTANAQIDEDLREIDFGRWECKSFKEIAAQDPTLVDRWAAFDRGFTFPGGESLGGFSSRVRGCARRLCQAEAQTVLVVTHGGVIAAMLCGTLGLRARQYVVFKIEYASCAVLDIFDGKAVLSGLNLRAKGDN
jgi:broad specificity phosphatase PhoE